MPGFIRNDSHTVGFLDLPELTADQVMDAVLHGFSHLNADAVLTTFCNNADGAILTKLAEAQGVQLVHSVSHDAGTTFILKRSTRR